jgi:hypothetical protein
MTAAEMDIVIGAEVDGAVNGLNKVSTSLTKVTNTSYTTRFAVQNVSNVFRDLPYALNNPAIAATALDHVMASVNMLKEETGSLKGAFGALASSLSGTGGLLIAFNLIGAAVSLLSSHFSDNTKATKEHKKATDEDAEAIKKATEATAQQLSKVTELIAVFNSQNTSAQERKKIIQDLKSVNETYFGQLDTEKTSVDNLSTAYDNYLSHLLAVAKAKAAETQIEKLSSQLIDVQKNVLKTETPFTNLNLTIAQAGALLKGVTGTNAFDTMQKAFTRIDEILKGEYVPSFQEITLLSQVTGLSEKEINERLAQRQGLLTKQAQLMAQIKTLSDFIAKNDPSSVITDAAEKADKAKKTLDITPRIKIFRGDQLDIVHQQVVDAMAPVQRKLDKNPPLQVPVGVKMDPGTAKKILDEVDILTSGVQDALVAAAEGLGKVITGKGGFFSGILQVIGGSLEALGKYVITTSVLVSKIHNAIIDAFGGNSIVGVALGLALITLGSVLQNIPKFATGGIVTRPTLALVGEQGPERITPLGYEGSAANAMAGEVVFTINGNALRGVLRRADTTANNIYGN